jgi:hypothetical protein
MPCGEPGEWPQAAAQHIVAEGLEEHAAPQEFLAYGVQGGAGDHHRRGPAIDKAAMREQFGASSSEDWK